MTKIPVVDLPAEAFAILAKLEADQAEHRFEARRRAAKRRRERGEPIPSANRSHRRDDSSRTHTDPMPWLFSFGFGTVALTAAFAGLGLIWLIGRVMEIITGGKS